MKRNLIILGCLLAVAIGLAAALTVLNRLEAPVTLMPEGETFALYELTEGVASLTVTDRSGASYTLLGDSFEGGLAKTGSLAGRESWIVDSSRIVGVLNGARQLLGLQAVEETRCKAEEYGLDNPRATVELTTAGGAEAAFQIGDNAPGNVGIYLTVEGQAEIWLVPVYEVENFLSPETIYLNHTITDGNAANEPFTRITLGGSAREEQGAFTVERQGEQYFLTSPVTQGVDENEPLLMLRAVFGMQADSIAATDPTPQDLALLGLEEPYATADVESEAGNFKLYASAPDLGGIVYLYREGVPLIYAVQHSLVPWLEMQYTDVMDPYAITPDINLLTRVTVTAGETTYAFDLADAGSTSLEGEVPVREALAVTLTLREGEQVAATGQWIDPENFQRFYITLISARLAEFTAEAPAEGARPVLTISYTYAGSGSQTRQVALYQGPPRRYYIQVDDGPCFLTPSTYLDRVLEDAAKVAAGQKVEVYSY